MYHVTPEAKVDSLPSKLPSTPMIPKFNFQQPSKNTIATAFGDAKCVLLIDFLSHGQLKQLDIARHSTG